MLRHIQESPTLETFNSCTGLLKHGNTWKLREFFSCIFKVVGVFDIVTKRVFLCVFLFALGIFFTYNAFIETCGALRCLVVALLI